MAGIIGRRRNEWQEQFERSGASTRRDSLPARHRRKLRRFAVLCLAAVASMRPISLAAGRLESLPSGGFFMHGPVELPA